MPEDALSEAIAALSRFLVADVSIGDTLQRVAEITQRAVPAAEFVGISMLDDDGAPTTAIFTDVKSPEIDQAQYDSGDGPCLTSWREQRVVRLDDTRARRPDFPEFAVAAAAHGIGSVLSVPLGASDHRMGALNLYGVTARAFSTADESVARQLATTATAVLANATAYWSAYQLGEDMRSAMESRAVIEQAKGILMAETPGTDAEAAFDLLAKASQRENVKLREIAARIVAGRRHDEG
jgi:GAF domain-containing protein